jgi:hypothetical protein
MTLAWAGLKWSRCWKGKGKGHRTYPEPQVHCVRFFELCLGEKRVGKLKGRPDRFGLPACIILEFVLVEVISSVIVIACARTRPCPIFPFLREGRKRRTTNDVMGSMNKRALERKKERGWGDDNMPPTPSNALDDRANIRPC